MLAGKQELVKRLVRLSLGLSFFGLAASILALSATGAGSMPFLAALWVFVPAPAVFGYRKGAPPGSL
jgi:hypothetical protein